MRTQIIAGNWKMNTDLSTGVALTNAILAGVGELMPPPHVEVVICPPYLLLPVLEPRLHGTRVRLGAQNVHDKRDGAFTGEISVSMLRSVPCEYVIVGH